ncbi:hypothetical protein KIP88_41210 [Bradyrhizobium sp. SRL28]|uniref:hypothetical protein n=1 Tax=Bradyrhizobium sp. SRL28 TaxID=2836178 RepID=UPI001BDE2639|nr:hypothetical protein [Bradyrhizobium sp. SRL28]MBT1516827.1 hypothetical protein [Bradyrhizobium sp. SRL28]
MVFYRRVIELAKAKKSLEEAARIMERTLELIRKVSVRLGVSFKSSAENKRRSGSKAKRSPE